MTPTIRCMAALAIAYTCMWSAQTFAQDNLWTDPNGGSWTDSGKWNLFAVPDPAFDARAVIGTDVGSGSPVGEVDVTSDIRVSNPAPEVALGDGDSALYRVEVTTRPSKRSRSSVFESASGAIQPSRSADSVSSARVRYAIHSPSADQTGAPRTPSIWKASPPGPETRTNQVLLSSSPRFEVNERSDPSGDHLGA